MHHKIFIVPALLLLAACGQPSADKGSTTDTANVTVTTIVDTVKTISPDKLIIPGKSIGQTHLNEDMEEVFKRLGKPDAGDAAMGKSLSIWYAGHDSTSHQTMIYATRQMGTANEKARAKQIRVTSPWFVTKDGIYAGATRENIEELYETTAFATFNKGGQEYTIYNSKKGIAFEVDSKGICKAIIIYANGSKPGGLYLPFYNNLKMKQ